MGVQNDKVGVRGDGFGERLPRLRLAMTRGCCKDKRDCHAYARNDGRGCMDRRDCHAYARNDGRGVTACGDCHAYARNDERGCMDRSCREGLGVRFVGGTAGRFQNERGERRDE